MANKNNAKFAFYYLLLLVALIFMAISVGLIAFNIINRTIYDPLVYSAYNNYNNQFKFALSALIFAAPIFYITISLIRRGLKKGELAFNSGIRRWLTYFILFVSSLIILGVLISTVNSFLSGELTLRFILKAVTVFIISALVFSFYFYDIKQESPTPKSQVNIVFLITSLLIVLSAFISVWFFIESPKIARDRRFDQMILNDINNLEHSVNSYYSFHKSLPDNLSDLEDNFNLYYLESDQKIEYKKIGDDSFEFCAVFKADSQKLERGAYLNSARNKSYEAGYNCLEGYLWEKMPVTEEENIN
jgi:hypothetical protein